MVHRRAPSAARAGGREHGRIVSASATWRSDRAGSDGAEVVLAGVGATVTGEVTGGVDGAEFGDGHPGVGLGGLERGVAEHLSDVADVRTTVEHEGRGGPKPPRRARPTPLTRLSRNRRRTTRTPHRGVQRRVHNKPGQQRGQDPASPS